MTTESNAPVSDAIRTTSLEFSCIDCGSPVVRSVVVTPSGRPMGLNLNQVRCPEHQDAHDQVTRTEAVREREENRRITIEQARKRAIEELATPPLFRDAQIATTELLGSDESQKRINRAISLASKVINTTVHGLRPPPLVAFIGQPGNGKTRLLYAIANELAEKHGRSAVVVKLSALVRDLRASWRSKDGPDEDARLARYTRADFLGIDEISRHAFYGQQIHQHLWDVINARLEDEKPTVITSNEDPSGLAEILGPAISSRLKLGGMVQFPDEDFRDLEKGGWAR